MILKLILSLLPLIYSYQFNNIYNLNFNDEFTNYNHLDAKNIENIEKLFNQKRYSPYRNIAYLKYKNNLENNKTKNSNNQNNKSELKQLLNQLNEEFVNTFNENIKNITKDEENAQENNYEKYNKKNGHFDPMGIYRYNKPTIMNQKDSSNSDEFSNENGFELIKKSTHTFKDIGGYDKVKKELLQTSDILTNYTKYQKYNVRPPKGIIFEGPPGNGKTLMAKGFCGEINASFIAVSGSEFSEKFVGVGASRVRDLFKLASKNKPCIIFIDEIDAVARKRGNDAVTSNSEKDQTLNQLLINLDGFKNSEGIFLIGATNRIDLLDPAILRPGRIDKNIFIGNPDSKTREEIIKIHLNKKPIDNLISIDYIVEMTGGMSGAQIENLLNEAMLNALRENREIIQLNDLEYIANRIIAGWQSTESKFSDNMIDRICIHEMGHAIVGLLSCEHSKLVKVTLNLWSPRTPGYTIFESNDENANIYTKNGLLSHLMVLLGGRIAEEIFYGYSVTTGARKDLEEAYNLAKNMILHYGMGKQNIYPDLSDQSKYLIDQEINKLLIEAHDNTCLILNDSKELIMECSLILKKTNLLKAEDIIEIIIKKYPLLKNMYISNHKK
jgi:cell division protease FtsH